MTVLPQVKPKSTTRTQAIVSDVRARLARGEFATGDRLPTIVQLCAEYEVSNITVRAVLRELLSDGTLESRRRAGIYVRAPEASTREESAPPVGFLSDAIAVLSNSPLRVAPASARENLANGWVDLIGQSAIDAVQSAGRHVVTLHPGRLANEVEQLIVAQLFGVVLADFAVEYDMTLRLVEALRRGRVPFVVYSDAPELQTFDRVSSDFERGSYELTRWMIAQGRRCIMNAWPRPATGYWYAPRQRGYERAMREADLPTHAPILLPSTTLSDSVQEMQSHETFQARARESASFLIEHLSGPTRADALLLTSDLDVARIASACRLFGLQPNRDVLLGGYDAYWNRAPRIPWEATQPCVTIDKNHAQSGRDLVQLLLDRVADRLQTAPQHRLTAPTLLEVPAETQD